MIIRELTLENWGPYWPKVTIDFARPSGDRNVNVLRGDNGGGKTSLLYALVVCLHGAKSREVLNIETERREHIKTTYGRLLAEIISESAECDADGDRQMALSMVLEEDGGKTLEISRRWWFSDDDSFEEEVSLTLDGEPVKLDSTTKDEADEEVDSLIQARIPVNVTKFFFFDGEEIKSIAERDPSDEVVKGLDSLLGFHLITQLSQDVKSAAEHFEAQTRKELQVAQEMNELDAAVKGLELQIQQIDTDISTKRREKLDLEEQRSPLRRYAQGGESGEGRAKTELVEERQELRLKQDQLRRQITSRLAEVSVGFPADLVRDTAARADGERALVDWERQRESLEPEAEKLIDRLFGPSAPSANPPLTDGQVSFLRTRVREEWKYLLHPPPDGIPDEPWLTAFSADEISQVQTYFTRLLTATSDDVSERLAEYREMGQQIDQLGRRIDSYESDRDSEENFRRYEELLLREGAVVTEIEQLEDQRGVKEAELAEKRREQTLKLGQGDDLTLAQAARTVAIDIEETLREFRDELRRARIAELEQRIEEMIATLAHKGKHLIADVDIDPEQFRLTMKNAAGKPLVRPSAGERELLALSMIWALGQISRRSLPLVIDMPFGRLDRKHVSQIMDNFLPRAARQVVILVTDSEVDERRLAELMPHVADVHEITHDEEHKQTTVEPVEVGA